MFSSCLLHPFSTLGPHHLHRECAPTDCCYQTHDCSQAHTREDWQPRLVRPHGVVDVRVGGSTFLVFFRRCSTDIARRHGQRDLTFSIAGSHHRSRNNCVAGSYVQSPGKISPARQMQEPPVTVTILSTALGFRGCAAGILQGCPCVATKRCTLICDEAICQQFS